MKQLTPEEKINQKLTDIYDQTINSDLQYDGNLDDIDYYIMQCKAAAQDCYHSIMKANVAMFNFNYEGDESVLIIFSVPLQADSGTKHVAERVMEIIETTEKCFINLDYSNSRQILDEKFIYVTIVKKVQEEL